MKSESKVNKPATERSRAGQAGFAENAPGLDDLLDSRTLIDTFLAEQRDLTAVEEFSRAHDSEALAHGRYQHLLPLSKPRPGEQYAFEVDLDQCSGCKGCVTACHSLNGLDDGETWRETGTLLGEALVPHANGGNRVVPLQQTVTTACHHCVEPACLLGCPVLAYDKDPITGIVRHLDDQCIGCSYCILKCPYEVPKYSATRGIVRKCDMCQDRLAVGEAPACVQACPNEAIQITLVQKEQVKVFFGTSGCDPKSPLSWLPDSPAADYTLPSTIYRSTRPQAEMRAADHERLRPQPAHWPLIFMLLLTQAGIGGLCLQSFAKPMRLNALLTLSLVSAGLVFSVLHLGQPKKAWRAWLGWRTSWLSREAIVLNLLGAGMFLTLVFRESNLLTMLMAATGLVAVFCQAMVYADTRRQFWALRLTAPRFIGSGAVLGLAMVFAVSATSSLAVALMAVTLLKLSSEATVLKYVHDERWQYGQLRRTALLQTNSLRPILGLRLLLGLVGGVFLPFAAMQSASAGISLTAAVCCFLGELAERYLFFTSVAPDKIPGTVES